MTKVTLEVNEDLNNKLEQYKEDLGISKNKLIVKLLDNIFKLSRDEIISMLFNTSLVNDTQVEVVPDHMKAFDDDHDYTLEEFEKIGK